MLLCGRVLLLHRGVGGCRLSRPASIYLDETILLHNWKDCKAIRTALSWRVPSFFVVQSVAVCGCRRLGGPPRTGPGCWSGAGYKAGLEVGTLLRNPPLVGGS